MSRELELRNRVLRLANGEFRPEDLSRLFLWLRTRSYGVASIREIGDFIAHSDERFKGLTTDDMRDFFRFLRFAPPVHTKTYLADVPGDFVLAVEGNFRRIESNLIKRDTGLKRKAAEAALKTATAKFLPKKDGGLYLARELTTEEVDVLKCCLSYIVVKPVLTDETLFRDFLFVLEKNRLLEHNGKSLLKTLKAPLALFAIAHMHQTSVEDGWTADLWGGHSDDQLHVFASAPTWPGSGGSTVLVAAPIFSTSLRPVEWCAPELLSFPDNGNHWFCGIELTSEAKLVPL